MTAETRIRVGKPVYTAPDTVVVNCMLQWRAQTQALGKITASYGERAKLLRP